MSEQLLPKRSSWQTARFNVTLLIPTGDSVARAAEKVTGIALEQAGLSITDLKFVISTGYGRNGVSFANKAVTEIICHAKGVNFLIPEARTVIDIGGQDSKVIGVREDGSVRDFVMNDKCAAGTGRFLEVMATVLGLDIEEMGAISLTSKRASLHCCTNNGTSRIGSNSHRSFVSCRSSI